MGPHPGHLRQMTYKKCPFSSISVAPYIKSHPRQLHQDTCIVSDPLNSPHSAFTLLSDVSPGGRNILMTITWSGMSSRTHARPTRPHHHGGTEHDTSHQTQGVPMST